MKRKNIIRLLDLRRGKVCKAHGAERIARKHARLAEGEGFEPSVRRKADNGFRDRPIRPLWHPSRSAMRRYMQSLNLLDSFSYA